jgi:lysyl-tRNA synthetase class II
LNRFRLLITNRICNFYTASNPSFRFEEQLRQKEQGDDEAQGMFERDTKHEPLLRS